MDRWHIVMEQIVVLGIYMVNELETFKEPDVYKETAGTMFLMVCFYS